MQLTLMLVKHFEEIRLWSDGQKCYAAIAPRYCTPQWQEVLDKADNLQYIFVFEAYGLVGLSNIKKSLSTICRLAEQLLHAWPGNKNRLFHPVTLYWASLKPDLMKNHCPSSAESPFH